MNVHSWIMDFGVIFYINPWWCYMAAGIMLQRAKKRTFSLSLFKNIVRTGAYENSYSMRCIRKKRYESWTKIFIELLSQFWPGTWRRLMEIKMLVHIVLKDYHSIKDINSWIKNWGGGVYFNIFHVGDIGWSN